MSPPLLPISPPYTPAGISGSAAEVELTSTPEDLIAAEANAIGLQILDADDSSTAQRGSLLASSTCAKRAALELPNFSSSSAICPGGTFEDIKMDIPLLPVTDASPSRRLKSVTFTDELFTLIPPLIAEDIEGNGDMAIDETETSTHEILTRGAEAAMARVEHEELLEHDTMMRLQAPCLNPVELKRPPHYDSSLDTAGKAVPEGQTMLSDVRREMSSLELRWGGASKVEKRLRWSAFPSMLGKVNEDVFDDGSLARYMSELSFDDTIEVNELLSYAPVVDEEDEEVLEPIQIEPEEHGTNRVSLERQVNAEAATDIRVREDLKPQTIEVVPDIPAARTMTTPQPPTATKAKMDMQTLLKKRKLELEGNNASASAGPAKQVRVDLGSGASFRTPTGSLAGTGDLSRFMRMHTVGEDQKRHIPEPQTQVGPAAIVTHSLSGQDIEHAANETARVLVLPVPAIVNIDKASIVMATSLLTKRDLMRQIHAAFPNLDIVERSPLGQSSSGHALTTIDLCEADITVSPATGIILTSLQKLKQQPLPGQADFVGVQHRVAAVSKRYDRLIVFVNEGFPPSLDTTTPGVNFIRELDERDITALADLMGLSEIVRCQVEVIYVPGGEGEVAPWLLATLSRQVQPDARGLIHDETTWERVFRKAGFNAFAAQRILATLKKPEALTSSDGPASTTTLSWALHGLPAFLQMSVEERRSFLGAALGGSRAVDAVSAVVDQPWAGRVHY